MEYRKHVFMLRNDAEADALYTFFEKLRGVTKRQGEVFEIPQNVIRIVPYDELSSLFCALKVSQTGLIVITRELRFKRAYISRHSKWNAVAIETNVESYESQEVCGEQQQTVARVGGDKVACRKAQPTFAQVGGDHYSKMKVQPIDFITANGLGYIEGNIIKYVCRYKSKNGVEDLKKAQHYLQMLIEQGERDEGPRQVHPL